VAGLIFLLNGALPFVVPVYLREAVGFDGAQTGTVMMVFMLGTMVDKVATRVEVEMTEKERSELIVQIEDETAPEDVEELVAEAERRGRVVASPV